MPTDIEASARAWLAADFDPTTKTELQRLLDTGNTKALRQGFGERMAFGTAGLRGLMGVGPANMNVSIEHGLNGVGWWLTDPGSVS